METAPSPIWSIGTGLKKDVNPVDAIRALKLAVVATFDERAWVELGIMLGNARLINGHHRLLRSLQRGDEDYESHAHQVLMTLLGNDL